MPPHSPGPAVDARPPAYTTGLSCLIVFAVIIPMTIVDSTVDNSDGNWIYAASSAALCTLRLSAIVAGRIPRLFEAFFWVFGYVFLGLAPLVQMRMLVFPSTTPIVEYAFSGYTAILLLLALIAALIGSSLGGLTAVRNRLKPKTRGEQIVNASRLKVLTTVMVLSGLAYIGLLGSEIFNSRDTLYRARLEVFGEFGNAVVSAYIAMGLLIAFIAQLKFRRQSGRVGFSGSHTAILLVGLVLFVCVNPISSPRFVFGTVLLGVLAAAGWFTSQTRFRWTTMLTILGLVFIFPLMDAFRGSERSFAAVSSIEKSLLDPDFDSYAQTINTVDYVAQFGVAAGRQLLGAVFFWVPRGIWTDKPVGTGQLLGEFKGYRVTNLSAPLPAELYINGGLLLLIVGMIMLGIFIRRWDDVNFKFVAADGTPSILGCALPFYSFIMLRGSLLQSMSFLAVLVVCSMFVATRSPVKATTRREPAVKIPVRNSPRSLY